MVQPKGESDVELADEFQNKTFAKMLEGYRDEVKGKKQQKEQKEAEMLEVLRKHYGSKWDSVIKLNKLLASRHHGCPARHLDELSVERDGSME